LDATVAVPAAGAAAAAAAAAVELIDAWLELKNKRMSSSNDLQTMSHSCVTAAVTDCAVADQQLGQCGFAGWVQ
jgi:hypothetical protein